MSAQHTPGPWHVSKASPTRVIESGPRGNSIAKMGLNLGVCSQGEAESNARLIAAAPQMLEALEGLLRFPLGTHQVEAAKKAIEKARGDV